MSQSITYYLTLFVIRLKGLKKIFSNDPIEYNNLRKDDIDSPKRKFFDKTSVIDTFTILKTKITEIKTPKSADKLVIYIHGGAFVSGPGRHHWKFLEELSEQTNYVIWMASYPKAPEHKIQEISTNIDEVYAVAAQRFNPENIVLIGDSAGGTLVLSLAQRLVKTGKNIPSKLVLISPVVDASMENPAIQTLDMNDRMLSKKGVLSAKKMCAGEDLKNPMISPLFGNFEGLPETAVFIAEHDITSADQWLLVDKLKEKSIPHQVVEGKAMPHIWTILPEMKEAKIARTKLFSWLKMLLVFVLFSPFIISCSNPAKETVQRPKVVDSAQLLSEQQEKEIEAVCAELESKTGSQIMVNAIDSLNGEKIETYANRTFNTWGIGRKDFNDGVLIVVAQTNKQTRIEVGYGLENIIKDTTASRIIEQQMIPNFKTGNYYEGILTACEELKRLIISNEKLIGEKPK